MTSDEIRFRSRDGLSLEACLDLPETPRAVLVLCHPHPKMGGTMNAPLLLALRDHLVERGWAVLRFNFRGIGSSEGESSIGIAEVSDALGAIDDAASRWPELPQAIGGWSFGGAVALRATMEHPEPAACVTIAPAIVAKPGMTAGAPPPGDFRFTGSTLVVCGSNDDQASPERCRSWAEEAGARYEEIKGANHFFWAQYEPLARLIGDFLDQAMPT